MQEIGRPPGVPVGGNPHDEPYGGGPSNPGSESVSVRNRRCARRSHGSFPKLPDMLSKSGHCQTAESGDVPRVATRGLFSWHTRQFAWENFAAMQFVPASIAAGAVCAASGAFAWGAVAPESQLFGHPIRRTGDSATMALTFDDGPNPAVTPALLDLLDRHGVRATFFVIGEFVRAVPALAREISARGHVLGNHTQTHPRLTFCSPSRTRAELDQCDDAIQAATGTRPG